jgi:hypothetical protein
MKHRGSAVTENSSAKYPKERQKLFGFAERRLPTPPPGASAAPAANASGINICADRWNRRCRKNWTLFENFAPPFPEKGVRDNKWVRHKWIQQTKGNFSWLAPRIPPAIKTQADKEINELENNKICNRNRLTVGGHLTRNNELQPERRHRICFGSGHSGCLQLANN